MGQKETGRLKVLADYTFPEQRFVINPNDGFDLGLMMTEADLPFYLGAEDEHKDPIDGKIIQKNECTLGTVELSCKVSEKIGSPRHVTLQLLEEDGKTVVRITPV
jgi:hypothetical protein